MDKRLKQQLDFVLEIDKEKNILRQTHLSGHGRRENDAEHAWHMAIMSYLLREYSNESVDIAKVMLMCLIHDIVEIDAYSTIQSVFEDADVIYFTGGNSFFLIDQLRKTGTDELLKKELAKGKLMIGESAGAIICAPSIQYIEQMDEKPEDYSQEDDAGLDLIDFYVLPHYLTAPFKKVTEKIMTEFSDLNLCPINNRQGIVIDGEGSKVICKD